MPARVLGVHQLDRVLAPVPPRSTLLLSHDPAVEAEPFLYQAAKARVEAGETVVYAVTNRPPGAVRAGLREQGLDPGRAPGLLLFVDAYSSLVGAEPEAPWRVADPLDPGALAEALEAAAAAYPDAVLLLDSLSTVMDLAPEGAMQARFPRLLAAMRSFRMSIALFTRWPYADDLDWLRRGFDAEVGLRGVEGKVVVRQFFAVERARWVQGPYGSPVMYRVSKPGGVVAYIPKILVTGPSDAGKSTFVASCSEASANASHHGTTVAADVGHATLDGLTADLIGTPGQARFDPLLRTLAVQAQGVALVVDATDPGSFSRAREMLDATWRPGMAAVVAANKQDLPGALAPDEVAPRLALPPDVPVIPCVATDPASAKAVLQALAERILAQEVPP